MKKERRQETEIENCNVLNETDKDREPGEELKVSIFKHKKFDLREEY